MVPVVTLRYVNTSTGRNATEMRCTLHNCHERLKKIHGKLLSPVAAAEFCYAAHKPPWEIGSRHCFCNVKADMTVKLITNADDLAQLESRWNALAGGMPFRSWDWLATWWKHYGSVVRRQADGQDARPADRQLYVLAVYSDARELLGVAPWYLD